MKNISVRLLFVAGAGALALSACGQDGWPPGKKGDESKLPEGGLYRAATNPDMKESMGHIYTDETMTTKDGWGGILGLGYLELPYNLFAIEQAKECYVENQYEVVFFDDERTVSKLDPDKKDHLIFAAVNCAGASIRYGEKVFTLKKDGWYRDEKQVRAF